jgi:hypothetical protein
MLAPVMGLPRLYSPTHETSPLLLHCPGLVEKRHAIWPWAWEAVSRVPRGAWPASPELTILTWSDQPPASTAFERCLDQLGLAYTKLSPEPGTRWVNYLKLPLAWAALDAVHTRFTMGHRLVLERFTTEPAIRAFLEFNGVGRD